MFFYDLFCLHSNNNSEFAPKTNIHHVKMTGAKGILHYEKQPFVRKMLPNIIGCYLGIF